MNKLALTIGDYTIQPPSGVPTGGTSTLNRVIGVGLNLLVIAALILSLIYLIWGGFDWIMSGGDKQKINSARQRIMFSIIGLIIVFLSFFILNYIFYFFQITSGSSQSLCPRPGGGPPVPC